MSNRRGAMRVMAMGFLSITLAIGILITPGNRALAQWGGGGGMDGGTGSSGTIGTSALSGVAVDANGVLRLKTITDSTGHLLKQKAEQAFAALGQDVAQKSDLRKVSLTRLARLLEKKLADKDRLDDTMLSLAGLTRIEYVFCYPDTGDVVIAGPAEPWGETPSGRKQGLITGRPVIELADLAVALRCFPPNGKKTPLVYCSIDPTPDGLSRMQQFLQSAGHVFQRGQEQAVAQHMTKNLKTKLGDQVITLGGVSPKTHFAQVLVEADYRMKMIGIGLERPPIKMVSYVDRVNPATVARNALQRWYFVPNYECIRASSDGMAMQMVGDGVKLVGEDEVVGPGGTRSASGAINRASKVFTEGFTSQYPKLAQVSPVYAQLRNCIDMLVASAFIQQNDFYGLVGWDLGVLGHETKFPVETENAPQKVASAVNAIFKGGQLMTPIGGGVQIEPLNALRNENLLYDEEGAVGASYQSLDLKSLAPDQWWWD